MDRQAIVDILAGAYADGRLTKPEFDERADRAMEAKTMGDLSGLTADLTLPTALALKPAASTAMSLPGFASSQWLVGVFSGSQRQGIWTVPSYIQALAMFGGAKIDMSQAVFTESEVIINLLACFGGVDVTVPSGTTVINETLGLFGGVDIKSLGPAVAGAPVVRLRGLVVFGGASVKMSG